MDKWIKGALVFAVLAYPAGYTTGAVAEMTLSELTMAVYKLINKYYELKRKVEYLEMKLAEFERKLEYRMVETNKVAYVHNGYVSEKYVVKASVLRVRACPSLRCNVIAWVSRGDVVDKLGSAGNWFRVRIPEGIVGWVYSKYLLPYY